MGGRGLDCLDSGILMTRRSKHFGAISSRQQMMIAAMTKGLANDGEATSECQT